MCAHVYVCLHVNVCVHECVEGKGHKRERELNAATPYQALTLLPLQGRHQKGESCFPKHIKSNCLHQGLHVNENNSSAICI